MRYVFNFAYLIAIAALSPSLLFAAIRKGKYREGFAQKLLGRVPPRQGSGPCLWLHAVSVGEVNVLQPLLAELKSQQPELECVISTTTKTGYELARKKYADHCVFYCPLDFSWAVGEAMKRIRPDVLVLTELELWPNLIETARRHQAKVAVVNGRLSAKSARGYGLIQPLVRRMLRQIEVIGVQTPEYARRFADLGAQGSQVSVTGSLKFDGAETDRNNARTRQLRQLAGITPEDTVLLGGSTSDPEEQVVLQAFATLRERYPALRLILVPRHPERFEEIAKWIERTGIPWQRRSAIATACDSPWRVLLVDVIGELGAWWGTADIGYVGGSMGKREGQNMIEPAAYGAAVCFGPRTRNFRDVVALLLESNAARVVRDEHELAEFVETCMQQPKQAFEMGQHAQALVRQQLGAAERTVAIILPLVPRRTVRKAA